MSDTSGEWFLTHGDGQVHGPYTLPALVQAARVGHVSDVTQVRHPKLTKDQWVPATRVRGIAEAMQAAGPASKAPPQAAKAKDQAAKAKDRPEETPRAVLQRTASADADTGTPVATGEFELGRSRTRPTGSRPLIVPESFGGAVAALFDFRFRYFVTPWIVTICWSVSVVLAVVIGLLFTFVFLIQPISATEGSAETAGVADEFTNASAATPQGGWQFQPPEQFSSAVGGVITYFTIMLVGIFSMFALRMLLEGAVVAFRIASDLSEVNQKLKENQPLS